MGWDNLHEQWMSKYGTRTDLALEAREVIVKHEGPPEIAGVKVDTEETSVGTVSRVSIMTEAGARAMGKMPGNYVTIDAPALRQRDRNKLQDIAELIAAEIRSFLDFMQIPPDGDILVVGLGNWNATPDALGPRTIHHLIVTRHFYYLAPTEGRHGARPVAGLSPGVLGITGIETAEIVQGLVRQIKPHLVVCIDALAARSTERLATTVQIADAGIQPGSGVGNKRFGITRQTLGVPVLAIGVPTVVHALTVVADGMERLAANGSTAPGTPSAPHPGAQPAPPPGTAPTAYGQPAPGPFGTRQPGFSPASQAGAQGPSAGGLSAGGPSQEGGAGDPAFNFDPVQVGGSPGHAAGVPGTVVGQTPPGAIPAGGEAMTPPTGATREAIEQMLQPYMGDLIMTPKEVDVLIEDVAETLAEGLNIGLHGDLDLNRLILSAIQ